jgi:NTE family protein
MTARPAKRRIALALGGGGARGLAHIAVLEALDEAGITPVAIAGTSIGAIIGAAYAAGHDALTLRRHALAGFRNRTETMTRLFRARVGSFADLMQRGNPGLVDAEKLLKAFWPREMPERIEQLKLPFAAVATDFYARDRYVLRQGDLLPAVAASMAIPGLVKPVTIDGCVLIDGGAVDPLPFDIVADTADLVIAIDVTGGPGGKAGLPGPFAAMFGASQIMQGAIVAGKLASHTAKVRVLRPAVEAFTALDFLSARRILAAAEPIKHEVARLLEQG